jgi:hypothetical protein
MAVMTMFTEAVAGQMAQLAAGGEPPVRGVLKEHFAPMDVESLNVSERRFPFRVRADLQRSIDRLFAGATVVRFLGVRREFTHEGLDFPGLLAAGHYPAVVAPPQYEDVDVGDAEPVRCLKSGLWLLRDGDTRYAVLLAPAMRFGQLTGVSFQVAAPNTEAGWSAAQQFFRQLEQSVLQAESYRGKVLSLEWSEHAYTGQASGIKVHKLRTVGREQVILPRCTLELLDRNVIGFVRNRPKLAKFRQATKKGILLYGPPGTGKTHTVHYLAGSLEGHTTLVIAAEQMALLGEYMTLARLLQPSMVVIEDVDLIARDRESMQNPCAESLLNKLLNEMDGLKEDADILFVLTTNRPQALEVALASRPGRVDQAIEFPLPDEEAREKLVRLYARGLDLSDEVVLETVRRTDRVSPAFIKELMRRAAQFHLERSESGRVELADVEAALNEMLFTGGSLNRKLLGGGKEESVTAGENG